MAVGTGMSLDVSKLDKELDRLDKKLDALIKKGEKTEKAFETMFKGTSAKKLLDHLDAVQGKIVDLSKIKDPMKWDSKSLMDYIDKVNRLLRTIEKANTAQGGTPTKIIDTEALATAKKEFQAMLKEVKAAEKALDQRRTSRNQTYAGAMRYSANANTLEKERQAIDNLKVARDRLKKSDADYATKLNALNEAIQRHEKNLKDATKTDKDRTDEVAKSAKKQLEEERRLYAERARLRREENKKKNQTYEGAMAFSASAKTLNREIQAVKNLEAARAKLSRTDTNYQKKLDDINARILQHNKNIAQATAGAKDLEKAHSSLGTKIASVFSIQAIRGYINQMIKVRGEMELQQRSLQAILQNKAAANEVWQKTIDLAVRSPFRIKDLVTYTKQLAAYRVEADKLYDTNKMLADVSAGLGVDMQRLILAFGQVKSANFLRGTELRQFTEAGIPMLDELAKLYQQMEGATVTAADVFDRISKRMVLFEDVEEVFKRMTAAGGTFYRMQEIQSETLKGQISNLKDSIDIMLNSMGKATDGVLKKSVKAVKFLVDNYQALIPVLKAIIAALALYKINTFQASSATLLYARNLGVAKRSASGLGAIWATLRVSLNKLKIALGETASMLTAHPWLLLIAAIAAAALKFHQFRKELREVDKEYSKLIGKQEDVYLAFRQAGQKGDLEEQIAEKRKQLQALVDTAKNEYGLTIDINVGEVDETKLDEEFNKIRQKMLETNAFSAKFTKEMIKSDKLSKWFGTDDVLFEEGLFEDIQDVGDSYEKLYQEMMSTSGRVTAKLRDDWDNLTDEQKTAVETLEKPIQSDESVVDYVERLKDAFVELNKRSDVKNNKISRFIRSFDKDVREAEVEFKLFAERFKDEVNNIADEEKKIEFLNVSIRAMVDEKEWGKFEENHIRRLTEQEFGIKFVPKPATPEELKAWQKSYESLFKGFTGYRDLAPSTSQSQVIERLQGTYESLEETIKRIEAAGKDSVLAGGAYEGQDLNSLKNDLADVKKQLDWFGAEDKNGGKGGKDEVLEKLKERINLIKEMNKEYEKLNKTFSKTESLEKVQKAYAETAKELGLDTSTMDFTDEGTIKSLEALLGKPEYAANKYVIELQKALDNFKVELGVEVKQEKDQDLKAQVQELFDQYDLSLELKKLNIPSDLAKSLFDVDYLDLDGLKKSVQAQETKFIGTDMEKEYKGFLDKIDDMEDKAAKERMKTYVKYLQEGMEERVKMKVEEMRKLKEIEESEEFTPEQKERIKEQVSKEAKKEQQKQEWEDFKGTDMYTLMFEDIEFLGTKALTTLQEKLEALKGSLSDLPADEVKEIIGQINKIEDVTIERNPFAYMKELRKELKNMKSEEEYQIDLFNAQKLQEEAQQYIDTYNIVMSSLTSEDEGVFEEIDAQTLATWTQMLRLAEQQGKTIDEIVKEKKDDIKTSKEQAATATKGLNTYKKVRKTLEEQHKAWGDIGGKIDEVFDASKELMTTLGVSTDSVAMSLVESAQGMGQLITSAVQFGIQMEIVGYQSNMALGVIGWILIAIQAVAKILSAIFSAKDKALQKQVEDNLATVENLQEKYESLEESIDKAWDVASIQAYNTELKATTQSMIKAQKAAIAAQEKRKGANKEGSDVYEELQEMKAGLDEMEKQLDESLAESFSKVTDGILDSVHDAAREFTDAWWEAFVETGDGLQGLEENFNEMFLNLAKNQAAMQITGSFADRWKKDLEKYINADDTELTKDEAREWAQKVRRTFPELSAALEGYLGAFTDMIGETSGGKLSELQKGIQGITEDTAQIIEAYLNSIRSYVSEQVTHTRNIYRILDDAVHSDAAAIRVKVI